MANDTEKPFCVLINHYYVSSLLKKNHIIFMCIYQCLGVVM